MNISFFEKNKLIWFFCFCLYGGTILFILVSLVSYNITDSSWFYVSSDGGAVLNQGGFIGAQLASLLYYLFGGTAFLVLIPLLCIGLMMVTGRTLTSDGERLVASISLIFIGAMLLSIYLIDFSW